MCIFVAYQPFEALALSYLPTNLVAVARYGPELILWPLAAVALTQLTFASRRELRPVLVALTFVVAVAVLAAVASEISIGRALIGLRAELRYIPLVAIVPWAFPGGDRGRVARYIVYSGLAEAIIGLGASLAGPGAMRAIAPSVSVSIDGTEFAPAALFREGTIAGTLNNYNHFGIVLGVALTVAIAAGPIRLGMRREVWATTLAIFGIGIVASGSRESVIAVVIALAVLAWRAGRRLAVYLLVVTAVAIAAALPAANTIANVDSRNLVQRWSALLDPRALQADQTSNFRLALLTDEVHLALKHGPLLGTGPGSVVDRRTQDEGTNPLFETVTGRTAIRFNFLYDGNWGLLVLEFGFLGLAAFVWLLIASFRVALTRDRREWAANALVALVPMLVVLGFFSAILQQRQFTAAFFVVLGLALVEPRRSMTSAR